MTAIVGLAVIFAVIVLALVAGAVACWRGERTYARAVAGVLLVAALAVSYGGVRSVRHYLHLRASIRCGPTVRRTLCG